jgi:hypothetical protein
MAENLARTTIGIKRTTKGRLDRSRAPGQCYDGFLCQLISLWEETHNAKAVYEKRAPEPSGSRKPLPSAD